MNKVQTIEAPAVTPVTETPQRGYAVDIPPPLPRVAEILMKARKRIARKWCTGHFYENGAVCALGGIIYGGRGRATDTEAAAWNYFDRDDDAMDAVKAVAAVIIEDGIVQKHHFPSMHTVFIANDKQTDKNVVLGWFDRAIARFFEGRSDGGAS